MNIRIVFCGKEKFNRQTEWKVYSFDKYMLISVCLSSVP